MTATSGGYIRRALIANNVDVSTAAPLPVAVVSGGGGGGGTVQIDQTTPGTTNGVQLTAGTALAGKVGIDQTTPGTTNGVQLTAGSALAGKVGIDQTTPGTTNAVAATLQTGSNVVGKVSIDQTTPGTTNFVATNVTQLLGSAVVAAASGIQKVGISSFAGGQLDAAVNGVCAATALTTNVAPTTGLAGACLTSSTGALTVVNVKATPGNVFGMSIANLTAAALYIQFYNTTGTPTLGSSVVWFVAVPASSFVNIPPGAIALANFSSGIGIGASTTPTSSGTPGTAPAVTIFYK